MWQYSQIVKYDNDVFQSKGGPLKLLTGALKKSAFMNEEIKT